MPAKLTTEQFIERARAVHGKKYNYSKVRYKNNKSPVIVQCPIHGEWNCSPANHIHSSNPRGCPKCGRNAQIAKATKPFDQFVQEATEIHGGKYKYNQASYNSSRSTTKIICAKHGEFHQSPDAHVNQGQGCPKCGATRRGEARRTPVAEVNEQLRRLLNGNVQLVPGTFEGKYKTATFNCSEHGEFRRRAWDALSGGHPCIRCGNGLRYVHGYTTDEFMKIIQKRFGDQYEVKPFVYRGRNTPIEFHCREHGKFRLQAHSVRRSPGCPSCAYALTLNSRRRALQRAGERTRRFRFIEWLTEAKRVHGTKYDYSEVVYSDARTSVVIICPIHGAFRQAPFKHLRTGGCRKCVFEDFKGRYTQKYFEDFPEKKRLPATLYYVRFGRGKTSFYKVGITSTTVGQRFQLVKKANLSFTVLAERKTTLNTAFRLEQEIQQQYGDASRYRPKVDEKLLRNIRLGPTECFLKPLPPTAVVKYFGS